EFLKGGAVADCCNKGLGYSAFLAVIYFIFGPSNLAAVKLLQNVLDLTTAVLIYLTAAKFFSRKAALISMLFYLINPFTSAYTGILLSETLTLFYIVLIAFLVTRSSFRHNVTLWFLCGIVSGLLVFTRITFIYFIFVFVIYLSSRLKSNLKLMMYFMLMFAFGFLVAVSYPIYANYAKFKAISITPPYNIYAGGLYLNFYNDRYAELFRDFDSVNPQFTQIFQEYNDASLEEISQLRKKFQTLFWEKFKNEWPLFIRNIVRNIFWMWDKYILYPYEDPFYPKDTFFLRWFNIGSIALYFMGVICYIKKSRKESFNNPLLVFTVLLFFYMTFTFTLVSNESRHSLPFYGLIYLWVGYGMESIKLSSKI
ncbi:glycosyltransferase family 39 protein, partial [Candidatus Gottesmanbacteria bacterium]|nr:glycosyltransferase family 39 protein [Candidatus Gottesmanbacteria bacterium]